ASATAAWLTLGLTICEPILFGAPQIYPDLAAGIIALALLVHVVTALDGAVRPLWTWAIFWLASGLLPWLHAKFALTALLLGAAGAGALWRRHVRGSGVDRRLLATTPLFVVGPVSLMAFNVWASGSPFGFHRVAELTTSFSRGAEIFLGLHFDQSQGMFLQQPLLAVGVVAFPAFAARRPRLALF